MREESLKFWKIEELSEVVEVLEDAFGDTIRQKEEHFSEKGVKKRRTF